MAKLSRKQAEEALRLKKEGLSYRKIGERLKEKYGEDNVPGYSNIYRKIKPVVKGEKTLDEVFSEEGEESEKKEKPEEKPAGSEDLEVGFEEETEEDSSQNSNIVLVILWILFAILVAFIVL